MLLKFASCLRKTQHLISKFGLWKSHKGEEHPSCKMLHRQHLLHVKDGLNVWICFDIQGKFKPVDIMRQGEQPFEPFERSDEVCIWSSCTMFSFSSQYQWIRELSPLGPLFSSPHPWLLGSPALSWHQTLALCRHCCYFAALLQIEDTESCMDTAKHWVQLKSRKCDSWRFHAHEAAWLSLKDQILHENWQSQEVSPCMPCVLSRGSSLALQHTNCEFPSIHALWFVPSCRLPQ